MTDAKQQPLLPLTPTERRYAELAYGSNFGSTNAACATVYRLRGQYDSTVTMDDCDAMLAELRREPASPCDEHDYRIQRLVEGSKQMRFLLEALIACDNVSASVSAIEEIIAAARKELGR